MSGASKTIRRMATVLLGAPLALLGFGQLAQAQSDDDFSGVWVVEEASKEMRTSSGQLPPLLPESMALYQERRNQAENGDWSFDSVVSKCAMPGVTRILTMPYPFQIFRNENRVVFIYEFNHNFRSIDIMEERLPADWGTNYGRGAASFAGDRMVLTTGGLTDDSLLDAMGMPQSEDLVVTEEYRLIDNGRRLSVDLTIEDPAIFSAPWETSITFRRLPNYEITEDVCLDRKADGEEVIDWRRSPG